jgi:hypothetical protein
MKKLLLLLICLMPIKALTQQPLVGDYKGNLGPLHVILHITSTDNKLSGTIDGIESKVIGINCSNFRYENSVLSFSVLALRATWRGITVPDNLLAGTWHQGSDSQPLNFRRIK